MHCHTLHRAPNSEANSVSVGGSHTYLSLPGSLPSTEALLQGSGCRGHGSPKSGSQLVHMAPMLLGLPNAAWKQRAIIVVIIIIITTTITII